MFTPEVLLTISAFGLAATVVFLFASLVGSGSGQTVDSRIGEMTGGAGPQGAGKQMFGNERAALPRVGAALMPKDESKVAKIRQRLLRAGLYRRHSTAVYLGFKFVLMLTPMAVGFILASFGMLSVLEGVLFGAVIGLLGNLIPTMWLNYLKKDRQTQIRRAMPDALDVIVVCVEGGLSLSAAFAKVSTELREVHPMLADEMSILQREIQLGRTTGEALRQFADRFDAEELRSLASVVCQAERFGASVVKALRVHADTLRVKRYQNAEAMAQKAPVKLIFPTVLFIFPALYIVLMGPAGVQLLDMLEKM